MKDGAATSGAVRLNLGSGSNQLPGYNNLDGAAGDDVACLNYWPDGSVDEVRASHVLEHFSHKELPVVLREWVRVLKPGGWLKIAVPDFKWIAEAYVRGHREHNLAGYLMGGQTDDRDFHKAVFDDATLTNLLTETGLVDIRRWQSEIADCSSLPVSLNLMGRKPEQRKEAPADERRFVNGQWIERGQATQVEQVATTCAIVMSSPRIGYLDVADIIAGIARAVGAPVFRGGGVFWSHGLTRAINAAMEFRNSKGNPADFIISVDYDTYATAEDLIELIRLALENPIYDVIVPMQAKRGGFTEILANTAGAVDLTHGLVPIASGHFGLTVFRRRVFERLEKPWFLEHPDQDGEWGENRVDPDMHMWQQFSDQGFKAALATGVVIGHGEEVVLYPVVKDGIVGKVFYPLQEWHKDRKRPNGVGVI